MKDLYGNDRPRLEGTYAERCYEGAASFVVFTAFGQELEVNMAARAEDGWGNIALLSPCCGRSMTWRIIGGDNLVFCSFCTADVAPGIAWLEEDSTWFPTVEFRFSSGFRSALEGAASLTLDPLTALVAVGELEASLDTFLKMNVIGDDRSQMIFPLDRVEQNA